MSLIDFADKKIPLFQKTHEFVKDANKQLDDYTKNNPLTTLVATVASTLFACLISYHSLLFGLAVFGASLPAYKSIYNNGFIVFQSLRFKIITMLLTKEEALLVDGMKVFENFVNNWTK